MKKPYPFIVIFLLVLSLLLAACNYPGLQPQPSPTATTPSSSPATPTPIPPLCYNLYFPNNNGTEWQYSGTTSLSGSYSLTNTIIASTPESFMQQTKSDGATYPIKFDCSTQGLAVANPIEQYAGAILNAPWMPVNIKLTSVTGITLPANIKPGDSWQQNQSGQVQYQGATTDGKVVFSYHAADLESVTVPYGTFNALRVNITISIKVTPLEVQLGTYDLTLWLAPNIGLVKSEGISHVPGLEFTDSMQLTRYTPALIP